MKRATRCLILGLPLLAACSVDPAIGTRYRVERDIWNLARESRRLNIRPELVSADQWRAVARNMQGVAENNTVRGDSPAAQETRVLLAGALLASARLYAMAGDSTQMYELYSVVERDFSDVPLAAGEVNLARGRLAESRREWDQAITAYREVVSRVEPRSRESGVAGAVMDLPLRIARMELMAAGDSTLASRRRAYGPARDYYRRAVEIPDTVTSLDARFHLADLAADLEEWTVAESELVALEQELRAMDPAPRDPAGVRFALAQVRERRDPSGEASRTTYRSVVTDYPESPFASKALLAAALVLANRNRSEEALALTQEVRDSYPDQEDLNSQALLLRGQILEREDRWTEAQQVFASIPVEHPVTEAALLSYIEIVKHYERAGDEVGVESALRKAETAFRDFLSRYPTGPVSLSALEKLARTLTIQKRFDLAVDEFFRLGEAMGATPQGVGYRLTAARMALVELGDTTRAVQILESTGARFPDREIGKWAAAEAARLRGGGA